MTRSLHGDMLSDLALANTTQVSLIELQFAGGTTRLSTGAQNVTWNSQTWVAVGGNLSVPELPDTTDDLGQGVPLELSGVDQSMLALVLSEGYRGRLAKVWHAHINTSGQVVQNPVLMFTGYMNAPFTVSEDYPADGGGSISISTRVTSRFAEFTQPHGFRCNVESHSAILAALGLITLGDRDTFFSTVGSLPGRKIYWGSREPLVATPTGQNPLAGTPWGPQAPPTNPSGPMAGTPWGQSTPNNPWGSNTNPPPLGGGGPSTGRLP